MSFLLDTDICSAHLKGVGVVSDRFLQYMGRLHISAVTLGELYTWTLRRNASPRRLMLLQEMLKEIKVLDVTPAIARTYGELRATLFDQGRPTPDMDLMIAATAITHELTLVTHNVKDYEAVPGLQFQDWLGAS